MSRSGVGRSRPRGFALPSARRDASQILNSAVDLRFRCPGDTYWIDRATHLARLAAGYAPCRACTSRFETGGLLPIALRQPNVQTEEAGAGPAAAEQTRAEAADSHWSAEGLAGAAVNEIDVRVVTQFALAIGTVLAQDFGAGGRARVAVAGDGRWLTAPLVAAASQGCRRAGCRVTEISLATAGSLAMAVAKHQLDGGILIGNALSAPETVSLKCWGPDGRPWSVGGGLDLVRRALTDEAIRTSRRYGGLERDDPTAEYRQKVAELFHGLRPLRWVLESSSRPLVEHLRHLLARSACEIVSPGAPAAEEQTLGKRRRAGKTTKAVSPRSRRIDRLRQQIARTKADFGLWIDGDGDTLLLVDEQGRRIGPERLLWAIWRRAATAGQTVVLTRDCLSGRQLFESAGARVIEVDATREAIDAAMRDTGAAAAAGPGGRLWLAGQSSTSDALVVVGWLLQLLSGQDRPISEMLA
jgi:phosphomannomutase